MSNYATTYYRSYNRALLKYVNNGFFARDLDADDLAYIERIRERGCLACGSLAQPAPTACTHSDDIIPRVALIEEMEFWQQPYQVDLQVTRRSGPVASLPPRPVGMTPDGIKRKQNRELKLAALAEEKRRAEDKQREQLRRDIEWERAAPKTAPFGQVNGRHYVPQWKINDKRWSAPARFKPRELSPAEQAELDRMNKKRAAARKLAREAADRLGQRLTAHEANEAADRILGIESESDRRERLAREHQAKVERERAAAQATLAKVDAMVAKAERERAERERAATQDALAEGNLRQRKLAELRRIQRQALKDRILAVMQNTFPRVVTLEAMMKATGCDDKDFMISCADELIREGRLAQKTAEAA